VARGAPPRAGAPHKKGILKGRLWGWGAPAAAGGTGGGGGG